MKKCPYCGEEIQDKAKKCRYCGEWFDNNYKNMDINYNDLSKSKDGKFNKVDITLKELCKTLNSSFSSTNITPFRLEKDKLTEKEIGIILFKYNELTKHKLDFGNNLGEFFHCKDGIDIGVKLFQLYGNNENGEEIYSHVKECLIKESAKKLLNQYGGMALNEKIEEKVIETENRKDNNEPKGLGGWLILVGFGLVISPFIILLTIILAYVNDFNLGSIILKVIIDFLLYIILFIFSTLSIYLFFTKSKYFPFVYKIYLILILISNIYGFLFLNIIYSLEWKNVVSSLFYTTIWLLYLEKSKRVKNTFIEILYNKIIVTLLIIISTLIILGLSFFTLIQSNVSNNESGSKICKETFGENTFYTGKQEDGQYLCDCKEGYEFGGENNNTCIVSINN